MTDLAVSFVHMHTNRMLRSAHPEQEFVISDFLVRVYESQVASSRSQSWSVLLENEREPGVQINGDEEDRRRLDQIRSRALPARKYLEVRRVFPFPRRF